MAMSVPAPNAAASPPEPPPVAGPAPPLSVHPVIFFDGVCGLCNRWVDFVLKRDRAQLFRFSPLQGETALAWLQFGSEVSLDSIVLVDSLGEHRKTDAVARILRGLGGMWGLAGAALAILPRPLRNLGYDLVAKNRYRVFGRKATCRLPTLEERSRFLP